MQKLYYTLLLLTLFSCRKSKPGDNGNYVTCKVNGIQWQASANTIFTMAKTVRYVDSVNAFYLDAVHKENGTQISVEVLNTSTTIRSGTYQLIGSITKGIYTVNSTRYNTDSTSTGVLNLSLTDGRASGTFSFKAINNLTSQVMDITDGQFSLPLQ